MKIIRYFILIPCFCMFSNIASAEVYHPLIGSVLAGGRYGYTPFVTDINVYYPMVYVPGKSGSGFSSSNQDYYYFLWAMGASFLQINKKTPMDFTYRKWTAYWSSDTIPDAIVRVESLGMDAKLATTTFSTYNRKHRNCSIVLNRDKFTAYNFSIKQTQAVIIHEFGHCMGLAHHNFMSENMYCNLQCEKSSIGACGVSRRYENAIDWIYGKKTLEGVGPILDISKEPECL